MNPDEYPSREQLNAFIDGELDYEDSRRLLQQMETDEILRRRVERLSGLKRLVGVTYGPPTRLHSGPEGRARWWRRAGLASAALVLLGVGFGFGQWQSAPSPAPTSLQQVSADQRKLLLHVSKPDERGFGAMLDRIDALFMQARADELEIEVVANAGGLEWLRADKSPFAPRIHTMLKAYPGLRFVACTNAIDRYEERGQRVHLIDGTVDDTTAIERIVMRLQQGWTYLLV